MDSTDTRWEVPRCEVDHLHGAPSAIVGDVGFRHCPGSTPDLHAHVDGDGRRNQLPPPFDGIEGFEEVRGGIFIGDPRIVLHLSFEESERRLERPPRRWRHPSLLRLKQEWVEGAAWLEESVARAHRWRYGRARSGATCDRIGPRLFLAGDAHGPVPGTVGASLASAACAVDRMPHRCAHETRFGVP